MEKILKPQIRQLNDLDLFRGVCDRDIFPVTITTAVLCRDDKGQLPEGTANTLEERLQAIEIKLAIVENNINTILYGLITQEQIQELIGDEGRALSDGGIESGDQGIKNSKDKGEA